MGCLTPVNTPLMDVHLVSWKLLVYIRINYFFYYIVMKFSLWHFLGILVTIAYFSRPRVSVCPNPHRCSAPKWIATLSAWLF